MKLIEKIRALPTPIFVIIFLVFLPVIIPVGLIYTAFRKDWYMTPELKEMRKIRKQLEKENNTSDYPETNDRGASQDDSRK
ncbi:MAG: hypothetical protein WBP12_05320 [Candidatus Saccharimonas sp.]